MAVHMYIGTLHTCLHICLHTCLYTCLCTCPHAGHGQDQAGPTRRFEHIIHYQTGQGKATSGGTDETAQFAASMIKQRATVAKWKDNSVAEMDFGDDWRKGLHE